MNGEWGRQAVWAMATALAGLAGDPVAAREVQGAPGKPGPMMPTMPVQERKVPPPEMVCSTTRLGGQEYRACGDKPAYVPEGCTAVAMPFGMGVRCKMGR